jgi:hypothetical protein
MRLVLPLLFEEEAGIFVSKGHEGLMEVAPK